MITKTYIYTTCLAGYYQWKVYKVIDAAKQVWYIGEAIGHGGTAIADTEEDLKKILESRVPILNDMLKRTR